MLIWNKENKQKKIKGNETDIAAITKLLTPLSEALKQHLKTLPNALTQNEIAQLLSASKCLNSKEAILHVTKIPVTNTDTLLIQLRYIHDRVQDRSTKIHVTKLINKISQQDDGDSSMEH